MESFQDKVRRQYEEYRRNGHTSEDGWTEEQRGDAWESRPEAVVDVKPAGNGKPASAGFPAPIPASALKRSEGTPWLWQGYLAPGQVTLFSALWKAGKTTLLAHLLRAFGEGGSFCGRTMERGRVLYITEESEHRWAVRRDQMGIEDHVAFLVRPFAGRADWPAWAAFALYVREQAQAWKASLVVFDPLVNLWPVRDENDNAAVLSALMPLHRLTEAGAGLLLVHHHRKADGQEGTASRGAGSLMGFVDTIIELRRLHAGDRHDRQRVLTAYGRDDETPDELVVELSDGVYTAKGDQSEVSFMELLPIIASLLPTESPGIDRNEVLERWPDDQPRPGPDRLREALNRGASAGAWQRSGEGRRGSPWRFARPS